MLLSGRVVLAAVILRALVVVTPAAHDFLTSNPVFYTAQTSWARAREGVFLLEAFGDPYSSGMAHVPPMLLLLLRPFVNAGVWVRLLLFCGTDLVAGQTLGAIAAQLQLRNSVAAM